MVFHVYILYSESYDKYYIGQTKDLLKRIDSHNNTDRKTYTSKYRPWTIHWKLEVASRSIAMRIEKYLKLKNKIFYRRLSSDNELEDYIIERFF